MAAMILKFVIFLKFGQCFVKCFRDSPEKIFATPRLRNAGVKCLSQRHNDTLPRAETELRFDNLVVAKLHFYLLSCTIAIVGILALSVFPKGTTACCVQSGRRTSTLRLLFGALTD